MSETKHNQQQRKSRQGKRPKRKENVKRNASTQVKVGQTVTLTIKRLGINGEGIGYYKKQVVFVDGALPDEVVVAKISKVETNFATAELVRVRTASPDRIKPPCPIDDQCGGCQLQHLAYEAQLRHKKEHVLQAFERYTSYTAETLPIHDTIGMDYPWAYRNKAQMQVGKSGDRVITGLYATGSHRLIDLTDCAVQHPQTNRVIQKTKEILQRLHIPIYNERKRTGVIRSIVTRIGFETGELQLVLVTRTKEIPRLSELILEIRYALPEVKSIMQNIHPQKSSAIFGEESRLLWGEERIEEKLGELFFSLSPRAFFQLNPKQTVKLYDTVKAYAQLTGREVVVDAYCGVGTIGLWLAKDAGEVRGMDVIADAIADAKENARKSGVNNAIYEVGKAEDVLPRWKREGLVVDVMIVDPPRTGCDPKLLQTIIEIQPQRLIYVSCNPSTLAKDCARLIEAGFTIVEVQPFDMFPHTAHVECCVSLIRK